MGSPEFVQALVTTSILPFGQPTHIHGDHRTLIVEFDSSQLFGNAFPIAPHTTQRGVYSNTIPIVKRFCQIAGDCCDEAQIATRIAQLEEYDELPVHERINLDQIDRDISKTLTRADRKCRCFKEHPWSPTLQQDYLVHRYWTVKLSEVKTKKKFELALTNLRERIHDPTRLIQPDGSTISMCQRAARTQLRTTRREAWEKRKQFLNQLLADANHTNDKQRRKLIFSLKRAEENRRCFTIVKQQVKPRTTGGLSHLLVPKQDTTDEWTTVTDINKMEQHLVDYSREYFKQAHGTPFTIPPLSTLLQYDALTEYGGAIHAGTADLDALDVEEATRLLLRHQKSKMTSSETNAHPLDFEQLMNGYRKWPERTTTSPSGRHLGIYKSMLKDFPPANPPPDYQPRTHGIDIMRMLFRLLQLAVKHTYVYSRWRIIWNMYLEKDPGNPRIDRLRALHLIEADLNLLFKWYSSKGFIMRAERANRLQDSQYGGRPGRSAIDLACKKMMFYDHFRITRTTAADISNDIARCFDRMVEACQNLSCRQHGADLQYLKFHAKAHRLFKYHVKHAHGVSTAYNQFTTDSPWYGAGQGLGDAAPRWVVQADSLISAYHSIATPWIVVSPDKQQQIAQGFDAFVDDTDIISATPADTNSDPIPIAQRNLNKWHDILKASGGELNPTKCVWLYFDWQFDTKGQPAIRKQKPNNGPYITVTLPAKTPIRIK